MSRMQRYAWPLLPVVVWALLAVATADAATLSGVTVSCDIALCEEASQRDALLSLAGLRSGAPWDADASKAAERALKQTGIFASVALQESPCDGGVCLAVSLSGVQRIGDVFIEPGGALTSEIQRRLFLRSGSVWQGDEQTLGRQRKVIEE